MSTAELLERAGGVLTDAARLEAEIGAAAADHLTAASDLEAAVRSHQAAVSAQGVIQAAAAECQRRAHAALAGVVTACLREVYGPEYALSLAFEEKRGQTEVRFSLTKGGQDVGLMTASGGGVVDLVSFALRVACVAAARPSPRRLIVLDEPMKFLDAEKRRKAALLVGRLAGEMGFQFVIVTHDEEFQIGEVVQL